MLYQLLDFNPSMNTHQLISQLISALISGLYAASIYVGFTLIFKNYIEYKFALRSVK